MPKTVTKVAYPPRLQRKKRVAAYARVSSGKDAMLHSLSAQVSYYNDLIQKEDGWEFVGVYSDEAVTGTKEDRAGFQQMLEDCRNGKIDIYYDAKVKKSSMRQSTISWPKQTPLPIYCALYAFSLPFDPNIILFWVI